MPGLRRADPGSQTQYLYPSVRYDYGATLSLVDPFSPDLAKFPLYANARPVQINLAPGDALYVPAHWFHFGADSSAVALFG